MLILYFLMGSFHPVSITQPASPNIVYFHNPARDNPDLIRFKIATFSTKGKIPDFKRLGLDGRTYKKGEIGHYLIQFTGPIRREWIDTIKQMEVDFPGEYYIPNHAMVARAPSDIVDKILGLKFVQWIGEYKPAYRISPALLNPQKAEVGTNMFGFTVNFDKPGTIMLMVHVFDGEDWRPVVDSIIAMGGEILSHTNNTAGGPNFIRARIPEDKSIDISKAIANMEQVFWVERYYQPRILNAWTRWINQSSNTTGMGDATNTGWYAQLDTSINQTPIYAHGLFGQGQVVGESDTGIDWDNPWWYETSSDMNFNDPGVDYSGPDGTKIKGYQKLSDDHDGQSNNETSTGGSSGHGTHTSTTICGDSLWHDPRSDGILARGDGMAPLAKMAFQDISTTPSNSGSESLDGIPSDLDTLFLWAYNAGARIHSNSWGSSSSSYTTDAMNCDKFMWNHKDFLIFFAMGNAGPDSNTIGSPATAKNIVSVGATQSGAGCNVEATGQESTVWQNPGDTEDRYGYNGGAWKQDGIPDDDYETVAWFSSHGPSDEGLLKPEICTAGGHMIFSGWSTGSTSDGPWADPAAPNTGATSNGTYLCQMGGTSMATPAAAGLAVLVREYYTEGWYPSGSKNSDDAFTPSGALIKATMIASTRNMTGYYTGDSGDKDTHVDIPTNGQGWGMVVLDDALYFSGDTMGLLVYDSLTVDQGGTNVHTFTAGNRCDLKVVMAYTDYYGTQSSSDPLVNDLDLKVDVDGTEYLGNVFSGGYSTTGGSPDNINPTEVVLIPKSSLSSGKSSITVKVIGTEESHTPQPFALVITGDVNQTQSAVELSEFSYNVLPEGIKLYWKVETDNKTKQWAIERALSPSDDYRIIYKTAPLSSDGAHSYSYEDVDCVSGKVYKYRLIKTDIDGKTRRYGPLYIRYTGGGLKFGIVKMGKNPFSRSFWCKYAVPYTGYTQIKVYDIMGRCVNTLYDGILQKGIHEIKWDASGLSEGIYFLKLIQGNKKQTVRLVKID